MDEYLVISRDDFLMNVGTGDGRWEDLKSREPADRRLLSVEELADALDSVNLTHYASDTARSGVDITAQVFDHLDAKRAAEVAPITVTREELQAALDRLNIDRLISADDILRDLQTGERS